MKNPLPLLQQLLAALPHCPFWLFWRCVGHRHLDLLQTPGISQEVAGCAFVGRELSVMGLQGQWLALCLTRAAICTKERTNESGLRRKDGEGECAAAMDQLNAPMANHADLA